MPASVEASFLDAERSESLVNEIEARMDELNELFDQIVACEVVVEGPQYRHRQGNLYRVRIQLSLPELNLSAGQEPHDKHQNEDPVVAAREAFDAIRRQLFDYLEEHQIDTIGITDTIVFETTPHGKVIRICFPTGPNYLERGFGFISTCDGREVYFQANGLIDIDFQHLELGSEVQFAEAQGEDGIYASWVWLADQAVNSNA